MSDPKNAEIVETEQPPAPSAEELAALTERAAQAAALKEQLLRTTADFENFRKRTARERQEERQYAVQSLLEKLVPVLDTFEMALLAVPAAAEGPAAALKTGVDMIHGQLRGVLRDAGLQEIDCLGRPFDPAVAEAVSQADSAEHPEGTVLHQLRKGYRLHERLVRPATVVIARNPQP
jgi:molecular chaperone GrpE